MKPIFMLIIISMNLFVNSSFLKNNIKKSNLENKLQTSNKGKALKEYGVENSFENVEYIKKVDIPSRTPEYAKPVENNEMHTATLIKTDKNEEHNSGLTERPNFLSPVIRSFATRVSTPSHLYDKTEGYPTFDLDSISILHLTIRKETIF